jgi:pimeloyl-ACP methyl ester carboxylesterase
VDLCAGDEAMTALNTTDSHLIAPTQFVEAEGIRFAYRQFGDMTGTPLVFLQHFRGGMDHWDPTVTTGLARHRQVILFDNAGVAASSGETPDTIEAMGDHAAAFIRGLGMKSADVLGFSIGGCVAQALTLRHSTLVRRLVLVGTAPRAGEYQDRHPNVSAVAGHPVPTIEDILFLFFEPSPTSQKAGRAFWQRRHQRVVDVDPPSSLQTAVGQRAALTEWAQPRGERFSELKEITQPTLVVNGNHDIMMPTINSYLLAQHIPSAEMVMFPDSGHGSLFQYPDLFVENVSRFLGAEPAFT